MSDESTTPDLVELVRRLFEYIERREWEPVLSACAPGAEWDMSPVGVGSFVGPDDVREFWEDWANAYEDWRIALDEIVDLGAGVVLVVNHQEGRPLGSSGRVGTQGAFVFEWGDGKVVRATIYGDIDEARAAAERLAAERE